jgi:putative DNA primase/helicase
VWFDSFYQRPRTFKRDWNDSDEVALLVYCQKHLGMPALRIEAVRQAVMHICGRRHRSEPREWLEGLRWDGEARLNRVMALAFGAEDSDYSMAAGANLFKACAARVLSPGCKADAMLVLEGAQGTLKSSALEAIAGPFYGSLHSRLGDKDSYLEMRGHLLIELPELQALSGREIERVKQFLSTRVDTYRPPYGRYAVDVPRQCVFVGTTNENRYLKDHTGARRFVPIRCGTIDLAWLKAEREQLFAEAVSEVQSGADWWTLPAQEALEAQEARYAGDPWEDVVREFLLAKESTTTPEILREAIKLELSRQTKREEMRVARILERLGWRRVTVGPPARRQRRWVNSEQPGCPAGGNVVHLSTGQPEQPEQPTTAKQDHKGKAGA